MSHTGSITIQDAIDTILAATSVAPLPDTVDTTKSGARHSRSPASSRHSWPPAQ